ncbi:hypothetical protein HDR58_11135 [bacterium]|nr:hypothetical protein [bacterium]
MAIQAVDNRRQGCIGPMLQGAAVGTAAGWIMKYAQPLTPQEKNSTEYVKVMNKIKNEKVAYNTRTQAYITNLKDRGNLSVAEDAFVKMFDGMKEGDHIKKSSLLKTLRDLQKKNPEDTEAFKRICKETSRIADETAKQCIKAYNLLTKHARPTSFFLITGAVGGAIFKLVQNILKTEVKH